MHGFDVNNVHELGNLVDQNHGTNATQRGGQGFWEDDKVISTDWREFNVECVFVVIGSALFIMANQLFRVLLPAQHVILDEIRQTKSMRPVFKLKIETVSAIFLLDVLALLLSIVLQYQLL